MTTDMISRLTTHHGTEAAAREIAKHATALLADLRDWRDAAPDRTLEDGIDRLGCDDLRAALERWADRVVDACGSHRPQVGISVDDDTDSVEIVEYEDGESVVIARFVGK